MPRCSLSTINREYAALMSLPYLSCLPKVMTSRVDKASSVDSSEIQRAMSTLNVNTPQATAIVSAMKTEGFVLIQG
jgi:senataxin